MKNITLLSSTVFALSILAAGSSFAEDTAKNPSTNSPDMRAQAVNMTPEQRQTMKTQMKQHMNEHEQEQTGEHRQSRAEHREMVREHMNSGETRSASGSRSR